MTKLALTMAADTGEMLREQEGSHRQPHEKQGGQTPPSSAGGAPGCPLEVSPPAGALNDLLPEAFK